MLPILLEIQLYMHHISTSISLFKSFTEVNDNSIIMLLPLLTVVVCCYKYLHIHWHVLTNRNPWYTQRTQFVKHSMLMQSGSACRRNKICMNTNITHMQPTILWKVTFPSILIYPWITSIIWLLYQIYVYEYMNTLRLQNMSKISALTIMSFVNILLRTEGQHVTHMFVWNKLKYERSRPI